MSVKPNRLPRLHVVVPGRGAQPVRVDLPDIVTDRRPATRDVALGLAKAADLAGLDGVVLAAGPDDLEPWVLGAHLLRATRRVSVFVPVRPGTATPQYAAKFAASLQRFSAGRLGWVIGGTAEARDFATTARDFWSGADGLPPVLTEHAFPHVLAEGDARLARLRTSPLDATAVAEGIRALAEQQVEDVLLDVDSEPGEVLRIAERVLPALRSHHLNSIGEAHVG